MNLLDLFESQTDAEPVAEGVMKSLAVKLLNKQTPQEVANAAIRALNKKAPGTKMHNHPDFSQFKRDVHAYISSAESGSEAVRRSSDEHVMSLAKKYFDEQGVSEAMKPSDIPPSMRGRLTMRDIEAERPQGAFRFRVNYADGSHRDFMDLAAAKSSADAEQGRLSRLKEQTATEGLRDGEYHVATVTLDDGSVKQVPVTTDEGFREIVTRYFARQGRTVKDIKMDYGVQTEAAKKKPQPTNPELWSRAKAAARSKFDVYPSAYANAWAAKWYKSKGGGWRMGKPKKD